MFEISIIIPTYNRNLLTIHAINSVLNQKNKKDFKFEIIVIDDNSTDNSFQDLKKYYKNINNITFYKNKENKGVSYSRNLGIKKSKYQWIMFLDSDDKWETNKIIEQIKFHKNNENILISQTEDKWFINNIEKKKPKKFKKLKGYIFKESLKKCEISISSVMMNKKIFKKIGYFNENLNFAEDYEFWIKVTSIFNIGLINKPLLKRYSGHEDQLSKYKIGQDIYRLKALFNCFIFIKNNSNIIINSKEKLELIYKEFKNKYNILFKGAIKYKNFNLLLKLQDLQFNFNY